MYSQEITRQHRTAFIIALDRSGSMQESVQFGKKKLSKAEAVAIIANALITELIDRCQRTDCLRNYYDVAVIGYANDSVEMLLGGDRMISIEEISKLNPKSKILSDEQHSRSMDRQYSNTPSTSGLHLTPRVILRCMRRFSKYAIWLRNGVRRVRTERVFLPL